MKSINYWIISLIFLFSPGCTTYNPATQRNELIFIPTSQEKTLGNQSAQEITSKYKLMTGTVHEERVKRIGMKVASVSDRKDLTYDFHLIDSPEMNAFTVPGGHIYMFGGLYISLSSDDQIAAVLAHEIGHCAAKHTIKKFQAALGYNVIGNIINQVLASKASIVASLASKGIDSMVGLAMSAYSRHDEYEADRLGVKYLYLSGYKLNAMIETFEVLQRSGGKDNVPLMLRTHPYIKDRILEVQKEIELYQHNRS